MQHLTITAWYVNSADSSYSALAFPELDVPRLATYLLQSSSPQWHVDMLIKQVNGGGAAFS